MAAKNKSNELKITRTYDAPVKAVWEAWTDPEQVAQWWGPRGFTLTHHSKDLRPGGHWIYTMHGPDGTDYPNKTTYYEVEKYSKLVYDHGASENTPPLFRVTVLFSEVKGKTKMEMTMTLPTPEAAEDIRKFIKSAGGDATWDRLAEHLAKDLAGQEKFVINRTFHASLETMYQMWTDPEHFMQWLPPTGMTMQFIKADIRAGGHSLYMMSNADIKMYGRIDYREMNGRDHITYSQGFTDEAGGPGRHPMVPTFPQSMLTTVHLTAEDEEHTRVTVTWEPTDAVTPQELETFIKMKPGMTQGWTGSFDKLEAYLLRSER